MRLLQLFVTALVALAVCMSVYMTLRYIELMYKQSQIDAFVIDLMFASLAAFVGSGVVLIAFACLTPTTSNTSVGKSRT